MPTPLARVLVLGAALLPALAAAPALAQDRYAQPYYGASDPWTGFYAGVLGGVSTKELPNVFAGNNLMGGVVAGYTSSFGPAVLGAELEGTYTLGKEYSLTSNAALAQSWAGVAKLKAGVAFDDILLYGTAGYGWARLDPKGNVASDARWAGGFAYGGGAEFAFRNGMSIKLEYTQSRYDNVESTLVGGAKRTDNLVNHAIKAGFNYRF